MRKAQIEFDKYGQTLINAQSPLEGDFDAAITQVKAVERTASPKSNQKGDK